MMLCKDTYIEHDHPMNQRGGKEVLQSLEMGRQDFREKYHGIDAWDDINNYIFPYIQNMEINSADRPIRVLGIDIKCGTPYLDVRNLLHKNGISETELSVFTTDIKYYPDLVVFTEKIIHDRIERFSDYYRLSIFDVVMSGEEINKLPYSVSILDDMMNKVRPGGYLLFPIRNVQDYEHYLRLQGDLRVDGDYEFVTLQECLNLLSSLGGVNVWISNEHYPPDLMSFLQRQYIGEMGQIQKSLEKKLKLQELQFLDIFRFWILVRKGG